MSRMGKGLRKALWLIARLVIRRIDFDAVLTKQPGHAEKIVAEYQEPVDVVVAIGGDGTIQEVINGIMKREKRPTLAVMPAGRGNDFCHLIGIGRSKRRALKYLLSPDTTQVDLLKFNDRYAGNVVGIGFDAAVQERSQHYKYLAVIRYLMSAVILILKGAQRVPMRIGFEGGTWDGDFFITVVGHTGKYARQIRMFPGLRIDGGRMKVAAFRPGGRLLALMVLFASGLSLHTYFPQVSVAESPWVEIRVGTTVKAQSDGDLFYIGQDETLRVELAKRALTVKAPLGKT